MNEFGFNKFFFVILLNILFKEQIRSKKKKSEKIHFKAKSSF